MTKKPRAISDGERREILLESGRRRISTAAFASQDRALKLQAIKVHEIPGRVRSAREKLSTEETLKKRDALVVDEEHDSPAPEVQSKKASTVSRLVELLTSSTSFTGGNPTGLKWALNHENSRVANALALLRNQGDGTGQNLNSMKPWTTLVGPAFAPREYVEANSFQRKSDLHAEITEPRHTPVGPDVPEVRRPSNKLAFLNYGDSEKSQEAFRRWKPGPETPDNKILTAAPVKVLYTHKYSQFGLLEHSGTIGHTMSFARAFSTRLTLQGNSFERMRAAMQSIEQDALILQGLKHQTSCTSRMQLLIAQAIAHRNTVKSVETEVCPTMWPNQGDDRFQSSLLSRYCSDKDEATIGETVNESLTCTLGTRCLDV